MPAGYSEEMPEARCTAKSIEIVTEDFGRHVYSDIMQYR